MARPRKKGLDYFPFDVTFFEDRGIRALKRRYGADGLLIYIYTLTAIYRDKGYYAKYDDDFRDDIGEALNFSDEKIQQVIAFLCERSLLDGKLLTSDTVLTSHGIQLRFQKAKSEAGKKNEIEVDAKLWVLSESETEGFIKLTHFEGFSPKNHSFSPKNGGFFPEKLHKENKRTSYNSTSNDNKENRIPPAALSAWKHDYNVDDSMIDIAVSECIRNKGESIIPYIDAILRRWYKSGIHTAEAAERDCAAHNTGGAQQGYADTAECKGFFEGGL